MALESNTRLKSSGKRGHQILGVLSEKRAVAFLTDCANLESTPEKKESELLRLSKLYADIVPLPALHTHQLELSSALGFIALLLQKGWDAPPPRERVWFFRDAETYSRHLLAKAADRGMWMTGYPQSPGHTRVMTFHFVNPPAHPTLLEAAFYYLGQHVEHAQHCANPDCPAPYFFATKKGQKYCSPECAQPARRASKLRWWNENRASTPKTKRRKYAKTKKA
ncbi:MAG: hypothetical protein ACLPLR_05480 [Terriglobales bacterium]